MEAVEPSRVGTGDLGRGLLFTLTAAAALVVGNIYYSQPLLGEIATTFGASAAAAGRIPTAGQLGYVVGLLLVTPLGDVLERRRLMVALFVLSGFALFAAGLAPNLAFLVAASLGIGIATVVGQIIIPFVAELSPPAARARNLATVLSAALVGVFLARTIGGSLGEQVGWRAMFVLVGAAMFVLAACLWRWLPRFDPEERLSYPDLLGSVWTLFRELPALRALAVTGALVYGSLSVFWAVLAFHLQGEPFHVGPQATGMFGLLGAAAALAAGVLGPRLEPLGARRVIRGCIVTMLGAYLLFDALGATWVGLVLGLCLLNVGAQTASVSNQAEIYRLHPSAQTRLNTIYKIFYFCGGAAGSALGAGAFDAWGWPGACAVGAAFLLAALVWDLRSLRPSR